MSLFKKLTHVLRVLRAYREERLTGFDDREVLEKYQDRCLQEHFAWLAANSPHFERLLRGKAHLPARQQLESLPVVDKAAWLASFDESNTAGVTLAQARKVAVHAEHDRNFSPTLNGCTVGLSSGTSGARGVFVVSDEERAKWAGVILAKLLPRGLLARERVAFFLRANSNLYTAVESRFLTFRFFDLFQSFDRHLAALGEYRPTIVVAPAQVLRALAMNTRPGQLANVLAISVAEVLDDETRQLLENTFSGVKQVYQATEGLLATTCEHGRLHLNEEHLVFEREWLDDSRFVPVLTDFSRRTQPLVRYRLNDVLRVSHEEGCPCGRVSTVIEAIEGRCDDQLTLPGVLQVPVAVFADPVSRAIARALPAGSDYELVQVCRGTLKLTTTADALSLHRARKELEQLFRAYDVDMALLRWELEPEHSFDFDPSVKRRRIRNQWKAAFAALSRA